MRRWNIDGKIEKPNCIPTPTGFICLEPLKQYEQKNKGKDKCVICGSEFTQPEEFTEGNKYCEWCWYGSRMNREIWEIEFLSKRRENNW